MTNPKAKTERLIVKVIDDETLVYDHGRASCLNEFAARVWRECDGETSVDDIAGELGEDERAVWLALHRLNKSKLLVEEIALPPDMTTAKSRREIAGRLGLARLRSSPASSCRRRRPTPAVCTSAHNARPTLSAALGIVVLRRLASVSDRN